MNKNTQQYWDRRLSKMDAWRTEPYRCLIPYLPERFSLLDIGCALGDGCEMLKEAFPKAHITGCDISPVGISKAGAGYFVCDILEDEIPGIYDYITVIETLEHLDDPLMIVGKCIEHAREAVFVSTPYKQPGLPSPLKQLHSEARGEHLWSFDENTFDEPVLVDVVNDGTMPRILYRINVDRVYSTLDNPVETPVQVAAYELAADKYLRNGDRVLDVGFGLGYGMKIMADKAGSLMGVDVDLRVIRHGASLVGGPIEGVQWYNGEGLPYEDDSFDAVTCVDVLEHVRYYEAFLEEMVRVARRVVFISTPYRRPEHTNPDGTPANQWHLREWNFNELDPIVRKVPGVTVDWNFLNAPRWHGPYSRSTLPSNNTQALSPALLL